MRRAQAPRLFLLLSATFVLAGCPAEERASPSIDTAQDTAQDTADTASPDLPPDTDDVAVDTPGDVLPPDVSPDTTQRDDTALDIEPLDIGPLDSEPLDTEPIDVGPPARAPLPGELEITELMVDPKGTSDLDGEWFEVRSTAGQPIALGSCAVGGAPVTPVGDDAVPAGGFAVIARSHAGPTETTHVAPGLDLPNGGGQLLLECAGDVAASASYDTDAPTGYSLARDPLAGDTWCLGREPYNATDRGSPGAPNAPCPDDDGLVDDCFIGGSAERTELLTNDVVTRVHIFEAGLTDATSFVDHSPQLIVQAGIAAESELEADDGLWDDWHVDDWLWIDVAGDDDVDGWDRYRMQGSAPQADVYRVIFRVSLDLGESWQLCDLTGTEDGFDPADSRRITVIENPCNTTACTVPEPAFCDGQNAIQFAPEGTCHVADGTFEALCTYASAEEDCAAALGSCLDGACVDTLAPPQPGEAVFTELAFDSDDTAPWFEVANVSSHALDLTGCEGLVDGQVVVNGSQAPPILTGQRFIVRGDGPGPDGVPAPGLSLNALTGSLELRCAGVIDQLAWDPVFLTHGGTAARLGADGTSMTLSAAAHGAAANDEPGAWCRGAPPTPGGPNPTCPEPTPVDWCRLEAEDIPAFVDESSELAVRVRVLAAGLTDVTPGPDLDGPLVVEVGIGPAGTDPRYDFDLWTWNDASPVAGWDDAEAPGQDAYARSLVVPPAGSHLLAVRATRDAGRSVLHCDASGSLDGFEPDQLPTITSVLPAVCDPNPCVAVPPSFCDGDVAHRFGPLGACTSTAGQGSCTYAPQLLDCAIAGGSCVDGDCVGTALLPIAGDVVVTEIMKSPAVGAVGEWVELRNGSPHTLLMASCQLRDDDLDAWSLPDDPPLVLAPGEHLVLARSGDPGANGGVLPDLVYGGGMQLAETIDEVVLVCLGEVIDRVAWDGSFLTVGGTTLPPLGGLGVALQLDPQTSTAAANDAPTAWCDAVSEYGAGGLGTPGAPNDGCPGACLPNPCVAPPPSGCGPNGVATQYPSPGVCSILSGIPQCAYPADVTDCAALGLPCAAGLCVEPSLPDWCRLQGPPNVTVGAGVVVTISGRVFEPGVTDISAGVDPAPLLLGQVGYGPDASHPEDGGWQWQSAQPNVQWNDPEAEGVDEYLGAFFAPAGGVYDYAFRFSVDGGTTWLVCDLPTGAVGEDGSENGYQPVQAGQLTTF